MSSTNATVEGHNTKHLWHAIPEAQRTSMTTD